MIAPSGLPLETNAACPWDRVPLAGPEDDLLAGDPELNEPGAAAKRLLLSRRAVEGRMPVLRAHLA